MRGIIRSTGLLGSLSVALMGALSGCGAGNDEPNNGNEPAAVDDTARSGAIQALRVAFPKARLQAVGNTLERVYGSELSAGATPEAAVERFLTDHAQAFGADAADLKPGVTVDGRTIANVSAGPLGLMFDKATGKYRYYLYRYGQERNGLRVHKSTLPCARQERRQEPPGDLGFVDVARAGSVLSARFWRKRPSSIRRRPCARSRARSTSLVVQWLRRRVSRRSKRRHR